MSHDVMVTFNGHQKSSLILRKRYWSNSLSNSVHGLEVYDLKTIFPFMYDMIAKKPDYLLTLGLKLRFYITYIRCMPCAVLLLSNWLILLSTNSLNMYEWLLRIFQIRFIYHSKVFKATCSLFRQKFTDDLKLQLIATPQANIKGVLRL